MRLPMILALLPLAMITHPAAAERPATVLRRFLVVRTFPAGALDGLDAAAKRRVNANNTALGVRWLHSFATADRTRTYCVYEGPSEGAVRQAAERNEIPVDAVTEIPVTLEPGPHSAPAGATRRFVVKRTFARGVLDGLDEAAKQSVNAANATLGVDWSHSYANADKTTTYCVYRAPDPDAIREAAARNGIPVDSIVEVPVDLTPR
jgi:hypothetical protein